MIFYSADGGTVLPDEWNKAVDQTIADAAKIIEYYSKKCRQLGVSSMTAITHIIIHFTFYFTSDWLTAYSQFMIAFELDRINLLSVEKGAKSRRLVNVCVLLSTLQDKVFVSFTRHHLLLCLLINLHGNNILKCIIKQLLDRVST
jgi:hypothetical protein